MARQRILPLVIPPASGHCVPHTRHVRVVGLLSSASGIGKSARLCMETLQQSGFAVTGHDLAGLLGSSDGIKTAVCAKPEEAPHELSIFHLNPPMLLPGILMSGLGRYYAGCNVGYWAWELEELPPEWIGAIRFLHAVIVPSTFCRDTVQRYTSKPVLVVPHPVRVPASHAPGREGSFRVLNIFRFGSSFERKNPLALIRAFRSAFAEDPGARLVLKTSDGGQYPAEKAQLLRGAAGAPNIHIIDSVWSESRMDALMQSADVYASLHRSEGFGLPLAEAIMQNVPVVATNWSGNTDFCSPQHTFAVDYKLVDFHDPHPDYGQVQRARWADASVTHAALQLRRVRADPIAARNRATAARAALCRYLQSFTYERALTMLKTGQQ
jgi:hypothetical protein